MKRIEALTHLKNVENAAQIAHHKLYRNATCLNCDNPKIHHCNRIHCTFFQDEVTVTPIQLPNGDIRLDVTQPS